MLALVICMGPPNHRALDPCRLMGSAVGRAPCHKAFSKIAYLLSCQNLIDNQNYA